MTLREWFKDWGGPVVLVGVTAISISLTCWIFQRQKAADARRAPPPPQVTITQPEAVLLASPLWMDEQSKFTKRGGTVYLIDVKGHKLAVVISDRGAGICELTGQPEAEAKP